MTEQPATWIESIRESRIETAIRVELGILVDLGLLNLGVDPDTGEAVYWATPKGVVELGMTPDPEETFR